MPSPMLLFSVPGTRLSFRATLCTTENPSVIALVRDQLPLTSALGHVVISGETFWFPTRTLSLEKGNMVQRQPGNVFYHPAGQTVCFCYGRITESAKVNKFGQVLEEDFGNLRATGELVYQQTVANEDRTIVQIEVSMIEGDEDMGMAGSAGPPAKGPVVQDISLARKAHWTVNDWQVVKARIEKRNDEVWSEEPDEIRKLRFSVVDNGAGSGGQSFSLLVHLKTHLLGNGTDVIYRMLQLTQTAMTLDDIKYLTRLFLVTTFNYFEFLGDLGLHSLQRMGDEYSRALDTVASKEEYIELTSPLLFYLNRMHRWIHLIFPWHLGAHFPHRSPADIVGLPKLPTYSTFAENARLSPRSRL